MACSVTVDDDNREDHDDEGDDGEKSNGHFGVLEVHFGIGCLIFLKGKRKCGKELAESLKEEMSLFAFCCRS